MSKNQSFETDHAIVRQWILDNRLDLNDVARDLHFYWQRLGVTGVEHLAYGMLVNVQQNVAVVDLSEDGTAGEWHGLLTRIDGSKDLVPVKEVQG
jgi:hypothetical protein